MPVLSLLQRLNRGSFLSGMTALPLPATLHIGETLNVPLVGGSRPGPPRGCLDHQHLKGLMTKHNYSPVYLGPSVPSVCLPELLVSCVCVYVCVQVCELLSVSLPTSTTYLGVCQYL